MITAAAIIAKKSRAREVALQIPSPARGFRRRRTRDQCNLRNGGSTPFKDKKLPSRAGICEYQMRPDTSRAVPKQSFAREHPRVSSTLHYAALHSKKDRQI
jgi:hypothetical protein